MLAVKKLNPLFRIADEPMVSEQAVRQQTGQGKCENADQVALASDFNRLGFPAAGNRKSRG